MLFIFFLYWSWIAVEYGSKKLIPEYEEYFVIEISFSILKTVT